VIVELLSASTKEVDLGAKKTLYKQVFRTRDYFVFDPFDANSLQGWHLDLDRGYQPIAANEQNLLWSHTLGLWLGTWTGVVEDDNATWLRFYDSSGLVLLPEEAERQRAEAERQKSERLAARLCELGEDPDIL